MAEIVRAGLVQQRWTGDKETMIAAAVDHIIGVGYSFRIQAIRR